MRFRLLRLSGAIDLLPQDGTLAAIAPSLMPMLMGEALDPLWPVCKFDVRGSCKDSRCKMQVSHSGRGGRGNVCGCQSSISLRAFPILLASSCPLILQHLADGDMTMSQAWVNLVERVKAISEVGHGIILNKTLKQMATDIAANKGIAIVGNDLRSQVLRHVLRLRGCGLYVVDAARACLLGLPPGCLHPPRGRSKKILPATRQKMAVDVPSPIYTGQAILCNKPSILALLASVPIPALSRWACWMLCLHACIFTL